MNNELKNEKNNHSHSLISQIWQDVRTGQRRFDEKNRPWAARSKRSR